MAERTRLRILFFLRAINLDRVFENGMRELLERGHTVHVVLEQEKRGLPEGAGAVFEALARAHASFSFELLPRVEPSRVDRLAADIRSSLDYLRYLEPEFDRAPALRERARRKAPKRFVRRLENWGAGELRVRALGTGLRLLEAGTPVPRRLSRLFAAHTPDVVLLSPLVEIGSAQVDVVRAAHMLGIPAVLLVASWDNLTNKGLIKAEPTLTLVWNEAQRDEAVRLHRLRRDRVAVVGAHTFDHWFARRATVTASSFAETAGLHPTRPFFLYTCSSTFVARDELSFVEEWHDRLRAAPDERLRDVGILIRPHPQAVRPWTGFDRVDPGRTAVWPPVGETPGDESRKQTYFHSLLYATAVVGINTSAFIEAAIVGRPVYTLLDDRFRPTQEGTLHFAHLADVLVVARDWSEHFDQLTRVLAEPELQRERLTSFVRSFVRPAGLKRAAAPLLADAIEDVVGTRTSRRQPVGARFLWVLLQLAITARARRSGAPEDVYRRSA